MSHSRGAQQPLPLPGWGRPDPRTLGSGGSELIRVSVSPLLGRAPGLRHLAGLAPPAGEAGYWYARASSFTKMGTWRSDLSRWGLPRGSPSTTTL